MSCANSDLLGINYNHSASDINKNEVVDVDDFIAVLQAWGPCQSFCLGDGVVDVQDLLSVFIMGSRRQGIHPIIVGYKKIK